MTDDLEAIAGARQILMVVLPVRLLRTPDWSEGPFPFELGSRRTDTATRTTYFAPASARVLYGSPGRPCRWYRAMSLAHDGLRLHGMELLRTATGRSHGHALAVLHFTVDRPLLPVLRAIGHRPDAGPDPLTGPFAPQQLFGEVAEVRNGTDPFAIARPYTIALLTPEARHTPALRPEPTAALPATADHWLWQLASRSTPRDFPLAPETAADEFDRLCGSPPTGALWSCGTAPPSSVTAPIR